MVQSPLSDNVQKRCREREKLNPTQSKYASFFDGLNQALVALLIMIKKIWYRRRRGLSVAAYWCKNSLSTSPVFRNNTSADGVAHWVN